MLIEELGVGYGRGALSELEINTLKNYEAIFIINPDLTGQDLDKALSAITGEITKNGGQIEDTQKWGKRRLAYEISNRREGLYYLIHFKAEGDAILKLERACKLNEDVVRVLITKR